MKSSLRLAVAFSFALACLRLSAGDAPSPPFVKSEMGYLLVLRGEVDVHPRVSRVMILPQVESVVLCRNDKAYYLMTPYSSDESVACEVPRDARGELLMRQVAGKDSNHVYFAGAMEVATVPILLLKGDELPVKKVVDGGWMALLRRGGDVFEIFVPSKLAGVEFSKKSLFDKFAEAQKAKGLVWWDGAWISEAEAERSRRERRRLEARRSELWKAMKAAAASGVVVLKNGDTLEGRLVGVGDRSIMFESKGKDFWLTLDDVAPLSKAGVLARGRITRAESFFAKARPLVESDPGMALSYLKRAEKLLRSVDSGEAEGAYERSRGVLDEVLAERRGIESALASEGKVAYHQAVFKNEVLEAHLAAGHVLLKRKYWLEPEQVCAKCHGAGDISCPVCHGKGWRKVDCPDCVDGRTVCPICGGKGVRDCSYCRGRGYVYKRAAPRNRYCFGTGVYGPVQNGGVSVTSLSGGGVVVVSRPYIYPYFSGSCIDIDGGDGVDKVVCPICGGRGVLLCPKTVKCPKCHGKGYFIEKCSACGGEGRIACPDCGGKGFHGEPIKLDIEKDPKSGGGGGVSVLVP